MKKKSLMMILCVILVLAGAVSATLFIKVWGEAKLFSAVIEQPEGGETRLILSVDGKEIKPGADIGGSGGVIIPLMNGQVTHTEDGWADKKGKSALTAPTITLSTSNGEGMDGIWYRVEIHPDLDPVSGEPYCGEISEESWRKIQESLAFGLASETKTNSTVALLGPLSLMDGYLVTDWFLLGDLPRNDQFTLDLSVWATLVAPDVPFSVKIVVATDEAH